MNGSWGFRLGSLPDRLASAADAVKARLAAPVQPAYELFA
jgi:hypothetical protein